MRPAERELEAEREHEEAGAERAQVDELAAGDHQPAEREAGERSGVGRAADRAADAVGERAADDAAAPAGPEHAREKDPERDEEKPDELRVLASVRAARPLLLDPGRRLGTQTTGPLLPPGHVRRFRAGSVSSCRVSAA